MESYKIGRSFTVSLTNSAQSLDTLDSNDYSKGSRAVIIAAPDANHSEGSNTGTIFYGNADSQDMAIPLSKVEGILIKVLADEVYLKSSEASGDAAVILPLK